MNEAGSVAGTFVNGLQVRASNLRVMLSPMPFCRLKSAYACRPWL